MCRRLTVAKQVVGNLTPRRKGMKTLVSAATVLLLAAAAVPWLIVEGLWQWARRRHFWDWQ